MECQMDRDDAPMLKLSKLIPLLGIPVPRIALTRFKYTYYRPSLGIIKSWALDYAPTTEFSPRL